MFFKDFNLQPIAARIFALLLVTERQYVTFDEIVTELQISKSSASSAIQILLIRKCIEYKTVTGERKRYFAIKKHTKQNFLLNVESKIEEMDGYVQRIIELIDNEAHPKVVKLIKMRKMLQIISRHVKRLNQELLEINS